jgi:hypothetical protein
VTRMRAGAGCLFWIEVNSMVAEWPSPSPGWAVPMPRLNTAMAARSMIFNVLSKAQIAAPGPPRRCPCQSGTATAITTCGG